MVVATLRSRNRSVAEVGRGHALRHDHPPGVEHELGHLDRVDGRQPDDQPVVPLVRWLRHEELVWLRRDEGLAFLLGEAEAHEGLVAGEREVDDPPDPKLHAVAYQRLLGPREAAGQRPHLVDRHHQPWRLAHRRSSADMATMTTSTTARWMASVSPFT